MGLFEFHTAYVTTASYIPKDVLSNVWRENQPYNGSLKSTGEVEVVVSSNSSTSRI